MLHYLTSLELSPGKIKQPGRLKGVAFIINFKKEEVKLISSQSVWAHSLAEVFGCSELM